MRRRIDKITGEPSVIAQYSYRNYLGILNDIFVFRQLGIGVYTVFIRSSEKILL